MEMCFFISSRADLHATASVFVLCGGREETSQVRYKEYYGLAEDSKWALNNVNVTTTHDSFPGTLTWPPIGIATASPQIFTVVGESGVLGQLLRSSRLVTKSLTGTLRHLTVLELIVHLEMTSTLKSRRRKAN